MNKCKWTKLNDGGGFLFKPPLFETSCNEKFYLDNDFKFCPGCSNPFLLDSKKYDEEEKLREKERKLRDQEECKNYRPSYDDTSQGDSVYNRQHVR